MQSRTAAGGIFVQYTLYSRMMDGTPTGHILSRLLLACMHARSVPINVRRLTILSTVNDFAPAMSVFSLHFSSAFFLTSLLFGL